MKSFSIVRAAIVAACAAASASVWGSDPASHDVTLPTTPGEAVVVEWTGTALPGVSGIGTTGGLVDAPIPCLAGGADDSHTVNLTVPDGAYDAVNVSAEFHVEWDEGSPDPTGTFTDPDLVLTVYRDGALVGYSDGGSPEENVGANNPEGGEYVAVVCPFIASQPTAYRARLTLTALEPAACITGPTKALSHSAVPSTPGLKDQELPGLANFDVFRLETAQQLSPVRTDFYGRHQSALFDRTMGKPTFLWARTDAVAPAVGALNERELLIEAARAHLRDEAKYLRLNAAMIDEAEVIDAQFNGSGPAVVRFRQRVDGYEVFHRSLNVLLDRAYRPVAVSGYFATDYQPAALPTLRFAFGAPQAIAAAWTSIGGALDAAALLPTTAQGEYQWYSMPQLAGSHGFERGPRVKRVYYPRKGALEPAYYVELFARARANNELTAYAFVVSANDLRVLHRKNLVADAGFTYRVFADATAPYQPFDAPLGNDYTPFTGSTPGDAIARVGVPTNLVTLEHAGISTGDPWLAEDATTTVGNHVDACIDSVDTPVSGIISNPLNTCVAALGDIYPPLTGANTFDYAVEADGDPSTETAQYAAAVNLFYMNNWLHDWWYNHGFDEVSGNAQTSNYDRGGIEGDPLRAQGQDASGRNNANMATPADGSSPTMQQYLFDGPTVGEVRQIAPVEGEPLKFAAAAFGPTEFDLTGDIVLADEGAGVSP
ncbi:MAG: M36 family metallopeptidase, partial [Gammaproteobacteria bacterium]